MKVDRVMMTSNVDQKEVGASVISAGIIPIFNQDNEPYFLLLRVYNYWDFPKGVIEPGESSLASARRELEEETGITAIKLNWGEKFYETETYSKNKKARYYLAETKTEKVVLTKNPQTGIIEHHEYRWCTVQQAKALLGPRVRKALEWALQKIES